MSSVTYEFLTVIVFNALGVVTELKGNLILP